MILTRDARMSPQKARGPKLPGGIDLRRLCDGIARDRRDLEPFRRNRVLAVRQLAGKNYSDDAAPAEVPVNLIGLYYQIMMRSLVSESPRVMYATFDRSQAAVVAAMEAWANDEIAATGMVETYKRAIGDALLWRGRVKIALATPADAALDSWDLKAGQPFMELIDPDDDFEDQRARRFDQCAYTGHRYRIPVSLANDLYARGRTDRFDPTEREDVNDGGDERIDTLGRGTGHREEVEDHVDLWEVYLARHKVVVTLRDVGGVPDSSREPVRVQRWVGPPCGPYHTLAFLPVPGNLQPKGPVMDLIDLHRHYNAAYRKLMRQTRDYKKILPYRGGNSEEIERVKSEPDGGMCQADNAETMKEVEFGGPAQSVLVMSDHIKQQFDFIGGNLALLGGRSPQSRTASQDKMLTDQANAGVAAMQEVTEAFVQTTMEAMNWYWWHHPTKVMSSRYDVPGVPGVWAERRLGPAGSGMEMERRGPMPRVKIDPCSVIRQSPQSRLAFVNQLVQTFAPMLPLFQQQGVALDANELLGLYAKFGNEPELMKLFQTIEAQPQAGQGQDSPGMAANTTRTYERYSHGGQGAQAQAADLSQNVSKMDGPVNPNQ